jgi:hypothetical protein
MTIGPESHIADTGCSANQFSAVNRGRTCLVITHSNLHVLPARICALVQRRCTMARNRMCLRAVTLAVAAALAVALFSLQLHC